MLNKVTLIGNLGADPEVRFMPNGDAVAKLNVATSRRWKDKASGEKKEATEWHQVIFYRRLAEIAGEYLSKGSTVYIEGRLQTRKYQKNGVDHYTTEVIAEEMHMLGAKGQGAGGSAKPDKPPSTPAATPKSQGYDDGYDDDIPF